MIEDDIHEVLKMELFDTVSITIYDKSVHVTGHRNDKKSGIILVKYPNDDDGINCAVEIASCVTEHIYYQKKNDPEKYPPLGLYDAR